MTLRERLFDLRHACVIAQEVGLVHVGRVETIVSQLAKKTSVACVRLLVDTSQVLNPVVLLGAVDVVDGHAFGDRPAHCHPDGMRDVDMLVMSESVIELHIVLLAHNFYCIDLDGLPVGIDPHAVVLGDGAIERDARFGACADVVDANVIVEGGRVFVGQPCDREITHSRKGLDSRIHRLR